MDVVGEVIDIKQPRPGRMRVLRTEPSKFGAIGRAFGAVAIDEIQQTAADALDGGNVERFLIGGNVSGFGAKRDRARVCLFRVNNTKSHRRRTGTVGGDEIEAMGAG